MSVTKRDGTVEPVAFDKILQRLEALCHDLPNVDTARVAQTTINGLYDLVETRELDSLAAETAMYMSTDHPEYASLAARIASSNVHKTVPAAFSQGAARLCGAECAAFVARHAAALDAAVQHGRDARFSYFALKTLERSYLKTDAAGQLVERPQNMLMRVAVGIHHGDDADAVARTIETYDALSLGDCSHATPTMFNAGTSQPQMASCFLMQIPEDSIAGIFEAVRQCAFISKGAGGIGISVTNVRAQGARIGGSGGRSNGLCPMLQVFDRVARYVDQGGGKRKGAFAVYVEPWHADIVDVLQLRKNHGSEELKARDLFYGLWVPDLFMRRVDADGEWSLFCPSDVPSLPDIYGDAFDAAYEAAEAAGLARRTMKARALWSAVLDAQMETGVPYMLYKDACNRKSNHRHLGTVRCSNLCTEIVEYTSPDEIAVCNLASIALPNHLTADRRAFDHAKLERTTRLLVRNLNRIIDRSYYPVKQARESNLRHRPIGIGVQGLADVFLDLRMPFDSAEARELNAAIFETLYFAALDASVDEAEARGPYASYEGSPLAEGILQPDMWEGVTRHLHDGAHDWSGLRARLRRHGARNSLLLAPMPTASTAQILGNTECFEPLTSNMFTRRVLAGEFPVINARLIADLADRGLWSEATRDLIIRDNGSVQGIPGLPDDLRALYRTVWELKMKCVVDMAADRGAFIDQSQSLNIFMSDPSHTKLTSMHFYGWRRGLKTGMYYLRTRAARDAQKVTLTPECASGCDACAA